MNPPLIALVLALQFLTRFPLPTLPEYDDKDFARAALAFPLVGLIIGLFLLFIHWLSDGLPLIVQAALVLLVWVWITGNLHLDGLADSADAWIGGHGSKERTLAIMKDPTCGPSGVSAVVLLLLLKFSVLSALLEIDPWLLILAPFISRAMLLPWFVLSPYVRSDGLATVFVRELDEGQAWLVTGGGVVATMLFFGFSIIYVLLFATLLMMGWRHLGQQRIGGYTGDTTGAMIEIVEAAVLLLLLIFMT